VTTAPIRRHIDNAMVKAIVRAFRWREMLESSYATIAEIATAEKPDIVEAIFGGRQPAVVRLAGLMRPFSGGVAGVLSINRAVEGGFSSYGLAVSLRCADHGGTCPKLLFG